MRLSGLSLCASLLVACGGGGDGTPPGPTPASVSVAISSADPISSIGDTRTLTATVRDASQTVIPGASVSWSTDNQVVATLSSTSGLTTTATAAGNGTATIRAQSGPASQTQAVTVAQRLASLALAPETFQVAVGGSQQLTATPKDANGHAIPGVTGITFNSSNEARAIVTTAGVVQGVSVGQATITSAVTRDGVTSTATATANVTNIPSTATVAATAGLAFDPDQVDITSGGTVTWAFGNVQHNVFFDAVAGAPANITAPTSNATVPRTFTTPGTFPYSCHIHPSMTGTVIVH